MSLERITSSAPKAESNIESLADWRKLKEQAPQKVEQDLAEIAGFQDLGPAEQNAKLWELLRQYKQAGNDNRFKGAFVANYISANDQLIQFQAKTARSAAVNHDVVTANLDRAPQAAASGQPDQLPRVA